MDEKVAKDDAKAGESTDQRALKPKGREEGRWGLGS